MHLVAMKLLVAMNPSAPPQPDLSISVPSKYDRFGFYLHYIVYNAPIVTILGREQLCQIYNKFQITDIWHLKFFMSEF